MRNIQSFAGTVLSTKNTHELRNKITEQVLLEILSPQIGKRFVTPEQFVKRYGVPYRQVMKVLYGLVHKKMLKPEHKTTLDSGREQSYFYFNATIEEATVFARQLLKV